MPRFILIGNASTEFVADAADAADAVKVWGRFQQEHLVGQRGPMVLRLLFDLPIVIDSNGEPCPLQVGKDRARNKTGIDRI